MGITLKRLEDCNACQEGISYFKNKYGDADISIATLITDADMPLEFKYWGVNNFALTAAENQLYNETLKIIDSDFVYNSHTVRDCGNVVNSNNITNSAFIYYSKYINDGRIIVGSSYVDGGESIYRSDFVNRAQKIVHSTNVNNSTNIAYSNAIVDCEDVYESNEITYSGEIRSSSKLENCYFCAECRNSQNLMFCFGLEDKNNPDEYYLFNTKVSKLQWDAVFKLYVRLMDSLIYVKEWPVNMDIMPMVRPIRNYSKHYQLSPDCISWIKSLPSYDEMVMYSITALPNFLS